jgi:hypothetical protein
LPLALGLLGGTAFGVALGTNTWLVVAGATAYFVAALGAGLYLLNRRPNDEKAEASQDRDLYESDKTGVRNE